MTNESERPIRVLLVDGNAVLAAAVQQVLELNGLKVDRVDSGPAVRDYVANSAPVDVVVLDSQVGDSDGHKLLDEIRADARWRLVRVIMMTSLDSTQAVRSARRAGADDYLFKPVRPERLVEHVLRMATSP